MAQQAPVIETLPAMVRPEIVREIIKPVETETVTPVIYRERVETEVRQVTQPIFQKEVLPPTVESKVLPPKYTEAFVAPTPAAPIQPEMTQPILSQPEKRVVYNEPVVQETVKHQVVEDVQPVIYKEVEQQHLVQSEQPVFERVVEAPRVISEERAPIERT
jgi:hypothetical protein